ncbi:MAG: caspase family protein [Deltaproteobacteria bacterium]|nr:caspase family protein [Deltaproteobacteria bacterium]
MTKRLAILIAIEHYSDKRIPTVQYAEADAVGFAAALEIAGPIDKVLLLSAKATKTSINSKVRQHVKALTSDDELFLFYAGHGFSRNGHNFITCHDTDLDDLADTSINLQELLEVCGKSASKRIALFLDSCESGITDIPEIRGIYSIISESELKEFFQAAEYRACFASCKTSEFSYSSRALKHGVWTYQVIRALEGNDPLALEHGRYVTANSLQNYLTKEVPRTLRKEFSKPTVQTPWFHGSHTGDFLISDLEDVLKRRNTAKSGYDQVKQVFLQMEQPVDIAALRGFSKKRGHRVPESINGATERFVENISQKEIDEEIQQMFERIRTSMKYKRRDLTAESGCIITPDFEFSVNCAQDPDDPGSALITRRLIKISPAIVDDDAFNEVFDDYFDELTFDFAKANNVEDLIDRIEDLNLDKIDLTYPPDSSYCEIKIKGSPLKIKVTAYSLTVYTAQMTSPKLLVESFFDVQKQLSGTPVLKAIAASST